MDVHLYRAVLLVAIGIVTQQCFSTRPKTVVTNIKRVKNKIPQNGYSSNSIDHSTSQTSSILQMLLRPDNYDKRVRPGEHDEVLDVRVNVHFNTLSSLDEENMEFDIDVYLRQVWIDRRLNYTHFNLTGINHDKFIVIDPTEQVWLPDIFMENSKEASFHMVTKKNEIVRLWPNGTLFYSVRISAKVSCFMELYRFPVDRQKCLVKFGCFKYTKDDVDLNWGPWPNDDDVKISPHVKLARYTITGIETNKEIAKYEHVGAYTYLVIAVTFKRDVGHYILQQYMPCSYIVLLSWVCFWIEGDCVGDRISIGITLVLTIVLLQGSLNTNMPKVSYSKYIDYYFNVCLAFLMASVIESLVVYKYYKVETQKSSKILEPKYSSQSLFVLRTRKENYWETDDRKLRLNPSVRSIPGPDFNNTAKTNISQRIDDLSKIIFPILFAVFNVMYHFYFTND